MSIEGRDGVVGTVRSSVAGLFLQPAEQPGRSRRTSIWKTYSVPKLTGQPNLWSGPDGSAGCSARWAMPDLRCSATRLGGSAMNQSFG